MFRELEVSEVQLGGGADHIALGNAPEWARVELKIGEENIVTSDLMMRIFRYYAIIFTFYHHFLQRFGLWIFFGWVKHIKKIYNSL